MYGDVVLGLKPESKEEEDPFEAIIDEKKKARRIKLDTEFTVNDLQDLVGRFKALIKKKLGVEFPEDPLEQLWGAIGSVFKSWNNDRAATYRKLNNIPASWGTAVNVQAMVFGNIGQDSGTGVAFTRDPSTGDNVFYRRIPAQRPGRGRSRRHEDAAAYQQGAEGAMPKSPASKKRCRRYISNS